MCRFCGHWLVPAVPGILTPPERPSPSVPPLPPGPPRKGWGDAPAIIAFILALLSTLTWAVLFFLVFNMSRLIQSLIGGACVAFAAVAMGIVGIVLSARRKSGARFLAIFAVGVGGLAFISMVAYAVVAHQVSVQIAKTPLGNVAGQIFGTTKPVKMRMKCRACGDEFEVTSTDLLGQSLGALGTVGEMYSDLDKALDKVQKEGTGYLCPKCGKRAAEPTMKCPACGRHFLPDKGLLPGQEVKCPHCNKQVPWQPTGFLDLGLLGGDTGR